MTQEQKAERYDVLVREGDVVNNKISKLKSQNAGINTKSVEYEKELRELNNRLDYLQNEVNRMW